MKTLIVIIALFLSACFSGGGPTAPGVDAGQVEPEPEVLTCLTAPICPYGPGANAVCCHGICVRPWECPADKVSP
jgi:hypothetical protein